MDKRTRDAGRKKTKAGRPRASTTGKVKNVKADQSNWRTRLQESRIKFDDDQKERYLAALAETGRKGVAALTANVSMQTVNNHRDNDPDFSDACDAAQEQYNDAVAGEVRRRGQEGYIRAVYNKDGRVYDQLQDKDQNQAWRDEDGNVVFMSPLVKPPENMKPVYVPAWERHYSDRMLELEAKRVDPSYRDKSSLDVSANHGGGVLVAPPDTTPEQFIKMCQEHDKRIEDLRAKDGAKAPPQDRPKK